MMLPIKTKNTDAIKTTNWLRIGDLSFFEGPILSLFQDVASNQLYLYDWVDRDKTHNRWMIYSVSAEKLMQFLDKEISHFDLYDDQPNKAVYISDIDNRGLNFTEYPVVKLMSIPKDYIPSQENYFDEADCKGEERIRLVVERELKTSYFFSYTLLQVQPVFVTLEVKKESSHYANHLVYGQRRTKLSSYNKYRRSARGSKNILNTAHNSIKELDCADLLKRVVKSDAINSKIYANQND
jgi:hypothetical protein